MQTYFKLKIFKEFIAPFVILAVIWLFGILVIIRNYVAEKWRKKRERRKKQKE